MTQAIVGFGQEVLASAAHNYAPEYAESVQALLFAMAETATGAPFTQQAYSGYSAEGYGQGLHDGAYGNESYGQYEDDQYYGEESQQEGGDHEQAGHAAHQPAGYHAALAAQDQVYAEQPYTAAMGVGLDVAVLASQRTPDGQVRLRAVNDGDTLHDGRGDPSRGDKIKIFFSANCACYVYVIGIDATGYVAQIFPEGNIRAPSPVTAGGQYLLPEGTSWWGLDDTRGIEHIYLIASRERRHDVEDLVVQLAGQRPSLPADYRPVREPAVVAMTRGLVQVQSAAPTVVPTEYGASQQFSPTLFQATVEDADLVITRWFRHE